MSSKTSEWLVGRWAILTYLSLVLYTELVEQAFQRANKAAYKELVSVVGSAGVTVVLYLFVSLIFVSTVFWLENLRLYNTIRGRTSFFALPVPVLLFPSRENHLGLWAFHMAGAFCWCELLRVGVFGPLLANLIYLMQSVESCIVWAVLVWAPPLMLRSRLLKKAGRA